MSATVQIELLPLGKMLHLERGGSLQQALFPHGVEFPCGGHGRCKGCRVKVLKGTLSITPEDAQRLSATELANGWRLACRARAEDSLSIELAQWEAPILSDDSVFEFTPREGWGVAVDIGTTTVVAQLVDLRTGCVLGVEAELNAQAQHGADIMSRVEYAVAAQGRNTLRDLIRSQVGRMITELLAVRTSGRGDVQRIVRIVLVGNTVMHQLLCGVTLEPLSHYPFEPASPGLRQFGASELGWDLEGNPPAFFLPCLGGFVGSDILAGILVTKLHGQEGCAALVDLGTNGEIVVGNRHRLLCASTAAGPAFEGARISMGMRAATGAISEVRAAGERLECRVLGETAPRGICGSGLVDAVAVALDLEWLQPSGRLRGREKLELVPPVSLSQWDIRELQLAKGAIAAGLGMLLEKCGAGSEGLTRIYLAGAFGNYLSLASARRIGLLDFPPQKIEPSGNTALRGAKLALFAPNNADLSYSELRTRIQHVALNEDERFQDRYVEEMSFPARAPA